MYGIISETKIDSVQRFHLEMSTRHIILAVTGIVLIVLGIFFGEYVFPKWEKSIIRRDQILSGNTRGYRNWKSPGRKVKFKIYFFNVTNAEAVRNGANPILSEVGPYVYDETRTRRIVGINETLDTIKFYETKTFFYNQKESGCRSDEEVVTLINAGVVSAAQKVYGMMSTALPMLNDALPLLYPGIKDAFSRERVKDMLFSGVKVSCESEDVDMICDAMKGGAAPRGFKLDEDGKNYKVALFLHINGTELGPLEIGRGIKRPKGKIKSYKDENTLSVWEGDQCNMINGTDGTVFAPMGEVPETLDIFAMDFCRSMIIGFDKMDRVYGLPAAIYVSSTAFEYSVESNKCFCPNRPDDHGVPFFDCPPDGLANVNPCIGTPVYISAPHYFNSDTNLLRYASGLSPKKDLHSTYVAIEPRTGTPLIIKRRLQMNVYLKPFEEIDILKTVSEGFFPFIWLEEEIRVSSEELRYLKSSLRQFVVFTVIKLILIIIGVVLVLAVCICAIMKANPVLSTKISGTMSNNNVEKFTQKAHAPISAIEIQDDKYIHISRRNGRNLPNTIYANSDNVIRN